MELVQWFFTLYLFGGVPFRIGPSVNEIQCMNNMAAFLDSWASEHGGQLYEHGPHGMPVCTEYRFKIETKR